MVNWLVYRIQIGALKYNDIPECDTKVKVKEKLDELGIPYNEI